MLRRYRSHAVPRALRPWSEEIACGLAAFTILSRKTSIRQLTRVAFGFSRCSAWWARCPWSEVLVVTRGDLVWGYVGQTAPKTHRCSSGPRRGAVPRGGVLAEVGLVCFLRHYGPRTPRGFQPPERKGHGHVSETGNRDSASRPNPKKPAPRTPIAGGLEDETTGAELDEDYTLEELFDFTDEESALINRNLLAMASDSAPTVEQDDAAGLAMLAPPDIPSRGKNGVITHQTGAPPDEAPIVVVCTLGMGDLAWSVAVAEALWAAMARSTRVVVDHTGRFEEGRDVPPDLDHNDPTRYAEDLADFAAWADGVRIRGLDSLQTPEQLQEWSAAGLSILLILPWLLPGSEPGELAGYERKDTGQLFKLMENAHSRVVACMAADREAHIGMALGLRDLVLRRAGDRLLTVAVSHLYDPHGLAGMPHVVTWQHRGDEPLASWEVDAIVEHALGEGGR